MTNEVTVHRDWVETSDDFGVTFDVDVETNGDVSVSVDDGGHRVSCTVTKEQWNAVVFAVGVIQNGEAK